MNLNFSVNNIKDVILLSDLHLDLYPPEQWNYLLPEENNDALLILSGDILRWKSGKKFHGKSPIVKLLTILSKKFKAIAYIPGNHEYHRGLVGHYFDNKLRNYITKNKLYNVFLLNNDSLILNKTIQLIGTTLWTPMKNEKNEGFDETIAKKDENNKYLLGDFNHIYFTDDKESFHRLNQNIVQCLHQRSVDYIENSIKSSRFDKLWLSTHHPPSLRLSKARFVNDPLISAFCASLDDNILRKFDLVTYGHNHQVDDVIIPELNTRFITNASGHFGYQNSHFNSNKIIYSF